MNDKDLLALITELVAMQEKLVNALVQLFPNIQSDLLFMTLPQSGFLNVHGSLWHFRRHGNGVEFKEAELGTVVDLENDIMVTTSFTAWRLMLFLESIEILIDENSLQTRLELLDRDGFVTTQSRVSKVNKYYQLAQNDK